jgi:hypothetical protein
MKSMRILLLAALTFFSLVSGHALYSQSQLGSGWTLVNQPAPTIRNPMHLTEGLKSHSFLTLVGGVAFEAVAVPAPGVDLSSFAIGYDAEQENGQRVWIKLGSDHVTLPLYDWQLGALAHFADSPYASCVTLFGELEDPSYLGTLGSREVHVINYHPAFVNTLLGLRLFQLDILIMDNASVELPKQNGEYILGEGEQEPDVAANSEAGNAFVRSIEHLQDGSDMLYRSYVICDYGQRIEFAPESGEMTFTGTPFFYCWRFRKDAKSYDDKQSRQRITEELQRSIKIAEKSEVGGFDERSFLIESLLGQLEEYDGKYSLYEGGAFVDMLALDSREARAQYAAAFATTSLKDALIDLTAAMDAYSPVYLSSVSEGISSQYKLVRGINPAVWDAGCVTLRTAAFFRFCRQQYPDQWDSFLKRVHDIEDTPSVVTPTVMYGD